MKKYLVETLAVILLGLAVFGLVHQQLNTNDVWFNLREVANHEAIVACFVIAAVALVVGKYLGRR